jgi:hypothetical protein
LLVSNPLKCYDCILVACLRKIQSWAFTSIIAEFRLHSGPERFFDYEQFIERYDISDIDLGSQIPEFLSLHFHLLEQEQKLLDRVVTLSNSMKEASSTSLDAMHARGYDGNHGNHATTSSRMGRESKPPLPPAPGPRPLPQKPPMSKPKYQSNFDDDFYDDDVYQPKGEQEKKLQQEVDMELAKLIFFTKQSTLSPGNSFDPSLSLIADKDDDD